MWGRRSKYTILIGKAKGRENLEDLSIDGISGRKDFEETGQEQVVASGKHGIQFCFHKSLEFLDHQNGTDEFL